MDKWEYKVSRVIFSQSNFFNETQNEVNDKINKKKILEFSIGQNGWELVQILQDQRQIPADLAMWKEETV